MDMKRTIKEHCEQHYAHEFEMNQFLKRRNLPKLTQEEIGNLNRPISIKNVESMNNL